eukprot:CAMPEP_0201928732 /NCGR_PEP_ID=MMETSP0903-20130614/21582_1 /ASSEMBLY_ACC=CAM_ASM_000552 /TAXON_ID=420261 /ORGANISM="Thalassiosira antarctica, Strain CCMP982" /LENGTH=434 /DNA_ID=CAMNT_0048467297 /DNA_START=27 /DNA_END=1331 /DNA_ORIENTATION=+
MPTNTGSIGENEDGIAVKSVDDGAAAAAAVAEAFAVAIDAHIALPEHEMEEEPTDAAAAAATAANESTPPAKQPRKKKKRVCKFPGCANTVKAQGHCQRHGAKTKRCKAPGCSSQAQGSHEGFCKRHWREFAAPEDQRISSKTPKKTAEEETTCIPIGSSVYDNILPASFGWKTDGNGSGGGLLKSPKKEFKREGGGMAELGNMSDVKKDLLKVKEDDPTESELIPILQHILDNEDLEVGWHRDNERLARGIRPPKSVSTQLESWEKQLAVMEMALIAGTDTKHVSQHKVTKILAHAWGREKGFHKLMLDKHCARRGDLDRKKRVDAGVPMSMEKKAAYKVKFEASKAAKKRKVEEPHETLLAQHVLEDYGASLPLPAPGGEPMESISAGGQLDASDEEQFAQVPPPPMDEPPPMEEPSIEVDEEMATEKIYEM